jgi:ribosomal protein L11 methyltransferase
MKYNEIRIKVNKKDLERTEGMLIENGFSSMLIDDPDDVRDIVSHPDVYRYDYLNEELMEDLQRMPEITVYFADDEGGRKEKARAEKLLSEFADSPDAPVISVECAGTGDDSEWLYKWQEHFRPTRVGSRIVVRPSWEEYTPDPGDLVIEMDPGMAFGSGLHETTSMCIRALESIMRGGNSDAEGNESGRFHKILDVGTGTGILAIAGVLLGADEALGIDIDTDAVRVAEENIINNGMSDRIHVRYGDLTEGVDYEADIIVANLMADLVIKLSPAAAGHLRQGGWYVTSGILDVKEEQVSKAIREAGFDICDVLRDGEWRAVVARKQ